jgi:ADP-heptose:LPS heptosyltransferase
LNPTLPAWAGYLREVAQNRGNNRVHLADAFCGLCQVFPPSDIPPLQVSDVPLPLELEWVVNGHTSMLVGIVLGAGDSDRRIPLYVWQDFIAECAERIPESYLLIIGGEGEREAALTLERYLPAKYMNRVVNACGRTTLPQLVGILNRCRWVVGSDTGPLHLGAMCGARVIGWYFSRARVHETGPYGLGHYVWQKWESQSLNSQEEHAANAASTLSEHWPVRETVELIREGQVEPIKAGWDLWASHRDDWGMFYSCDVKPDEAVHRRKDTWEALSRLMGDKVQVKALR